MTPAIPTTTRADHPHLPAVRIMWSSASLNQAVLARRGSGALSHSVMGFAISGSRS